jgi:SlyX protein
MSELNDRIESLETRLAHQEKMIGELSDVVTGQWHKIEALERQLRHLDEEMQAMDSGPVPVDKPPHY